jgi:hypothetical protein
MNLLPFVPDNAAAVWTVMLLLVVTLVVAYVGENRANE